MEQVSTPQVMEQADFAVLICDEALLSRGHDDARFIDGQWPSAETKLDRYAHDAWWMFPLVVAAFEAILDEVKEHGFCQSHTAWRDWAVNLGYRANDRCPGYASWFAYWAAAALVRVLSFSRNVPESIVLHYGGRGRFTIERDGGGIVRIERYQEPKSVAAAVTTPAP